ncbi:MAG TPA: PEGA domain-containing protein [Polyangiaceae bacterium]|nr:PEGA domain-containing protein [Polyangiaceae bacterium]
MRLRRTPRWRALGAVAFLVRGLLGSSAAEAQSSVEAAGQPATRGAKEHYLRGIEFAERHSWANALAEFNASLALRPTSAASMNAAYCLQQLGRNAEALQRYRTVLRDFDSALVERERQSVRTSIAELELAVGHLALTCDVDDATVLIDDEARGKTPIGDLLLDPGLHVVRILKEGYEPAQVSLTIAATQTTQWEARLWKFGEPPQPVAQPSEPPAKPIPRAPARFVLELQGGLALYHSLGSGADQSCSTEIVIDGATHPSCPGRNFLSLGFLLSARFGYRVRSHVSLEATVGYLRLWHDLPRRMRVFDANGQAYESVQSPLDDSWAIDQTRVSMPFIGIGASRDFFDRTPLLLRLTTGLGRATVRTALSGSFIAASGDNPSPFAISVLEDAHTFWIPFIAPEARIGYRFAANWVADVGLAAWLLWAPSYPRTTSIVPGTPPEERWVLRADGGDPVRLGIESALGATLMAVPSLSVRSEF